MLDRVGDRSSWVDAILDRVGDRSSWVDAIHGFVIVRYVGVLVVVVVVVGRANLADTCWEDSTGKMVVRFYGSFRCPCWCPR